MVKPRVISAPRMHSCHSTLSHNKTSARRSAAASHSANRIVPTPHREGLPKAHKRVAVRPESAKTSAPAHQVKSPETLPSSPHAAAAPSRRRPFVEELLYATGRVASGAAMLIAMFFCSPLLLPTAIKELWERWLNVKEEQV